MRRFAWVTLALGCGVTGPMETDTETLVFQFPDEDGDSIMDLHEGRDTERDSDADGTADYADLDSDEDGVPDAVEAGDEDPATWPFDTDLDGAEDFIDVDADGNCLPDAQEGGDDLDGDAHPAASDLDDDGDGISDVIELAADCSAPDSDADGTPDFQDLDSDGDGIGDVFEGAVGAFDPDPADTDGDGTPDVLDDDSDADGFPDAVEGGVDDPLLEPVDTDSDGLFDFVDTDSDNDGLTDDRERDVWLTDPYNSDTDGDGFTDGSEVAVGTDALDPGSIIEGVYVVVPERTDVIEAFEFELSVQMGDVAFIIDTTCSMQSTLDAVSGEFSKLIDEIGDSIPDAEYGAAIFDDYDYSGMGSGEDVPFRLENQITSNDSAVQNALDGLVLHNGGDTVESGMEALYQALNGYGYDQNCDGGYDNGVDVPPFQPAPLDPFGGAHPGSDDPASPGGGDVGGMGFRDAALPILVIATDATMRNAAEGDTPGGCPRDAATADVINAANAIGAKIIGVSVGGSAAVTQMNTLADGTGSLADIDGDGVVDDRLVFQWSGSSAQFRSTIVGAIDDLVESIQFEEVTLEVLDDPYGFVVDIEPEAIDVAGAILGDVVNFDLTFRGTVAASDQDQLYTLTLQVFGDGTVLLDTLDIYVLVPGTEV